MTTTSKRLLAAMVGLAVAFSAVTSASASPAPNYVTDSCYHGGAVAVKALLDLEYAAIQRHGGDYIGSAIVPGGVAVSYTGAPTALDRGLMLNASYHGEGYEAMHGCTPEQVPTFAT